MKKCFVSRVSGLQLFRPEVPVEVREAPGLDLIVDGIIKGRTPFRMVPGQVIRAEGQGRLVVLSESAPWPNAVEVLS